MAWVESTFRFLPSFFFFGGRTTRERAPSLHFPVRRGELPGWAHSTPQSGRRFEQRSGLPVQRQSWAPGRDGTEQQRGVSAGTPGSEVRQPDTASARTTRKDSSGMLDLRQTSPGRGLDLAVWRQPGGPGPGKPWSPLSACMAAEDLVAADVGTTGMHSGCGRSLRQTGPGQEKAGVHFPVGSLRLHSPYTAAWCWIWGGHILGKVCTEAAQVPTGNTAPQFLQPQHLSPQPRHTTA